jgi:hypothetical protein
MADESPRASSCAHCGCSCASKTSQGGEGSKRPASLLGASTDDDVPSDERAKRLARRALSALHPNAVEKLKPEFGVVKNGNRQQFQITFCCKVCGMAARSQVTGIYIVLHTPLGRQARRRCSIPQRYFSMAVP